MRVATECLKLEPCTPTAKRPCLPAGRVVFHGPRQEILPYFSTVGFHPPERKNPADFVQEVSHTDKLLLSGSLPDAWRSTTGMCCGASTQMGSALRCAEAALVQS